MSLKVLKNLWAQINKDDTNFKKANKESKTSKNYLQSRLVILESNFQASMNANRDAVTNAETDTESSKIDEIFDSIKELYVTYRASLLDHLEKVTPTSVPGKSTSTVASSKRHELRLPTINLPTFSGSYENWKSFHDIFHSLVHSDSTLTEIEKLHHLKSSITGEAERLLQHLSLDSDNYQKAWDILTNRYDHKRVLVNTQLKLFFGQSVITAEDSNNIKHLLDVSTECLHALKNLGVQTNNWDIIVIYVMLHKLPALTQQLWEERLGSKKELPTLAEFSEFLEARFRTLEAVDQQKLKPKSKPEAQTRQPAKNSFTTRPKQKQQYSCSICNNGQHSLRKCNKFLTMDVGKRCNEIRMLGICQNCLAYSHHTQQCPSRVCCYFCGQRHHSLLHNSYNSSPNSHPTHMSSYTTPHNSIQSNHTPHTNTSHYPYTHSQLPHTYTQPHQTSQNSTQPNTQSQTFQTTIVNPNAPAFHPTNDSQPSTTSTLNNFHTQHNTNTQVLLATAIVKVRAKSGKYFNLRALIDPGSEASFITGSAVQLLNLRNKRTFIEVSGLGKVSSGACHNYVDLSFGSLHSAYEGHTRAFVFKSLTGLLPSQKVDFNKWTHINGLMLADPCYHTPATVDLLLGSDVYAEILLPDIIRAEKFTAPVAQKTQLGWILLGKAPVASQTIRSFVQLFDLDIQLRKFWEIEEQAFETYESEEDAACERHFSEHTKLLPDGRYQVRLPFKGNTYPILGSSYQGALRRFDQMERRFKNNAILYEGYKKCMEEYKQLGHMTEVSRDILNTHYHYVVPHHAVLKESSTTTKLRVVFDAAFKTTFGSSLNDHLMVGPKKQNNIIDVILRWRKHRFTFTTDMEKMYRQIRMDPTDANYQLILWRDLQQQVKLYRLETVTFGTASAPYLAIRVLLKLGEDEASSFPLATSIIRNDTYVDDMITGADTLEHALKKRDEVRKVLASAGFNLRKWTSNTDELLQGIPTEDREVDFSLPFDELIHVNTLGMKWLPVCDSLTYNVVHQEDVDITKRNVLSSIAKLFDPLGWLSPCIVKAKILMQNLWARGLEWDAPVPQDVKHEWTVFHTELSAIEKLRIPRWIQTGTHDNDLEIHGFSDASEKAYAAVTYLRVLDEDNKIHMHLLMSKTKVAPLKSVTLPRLELCGAVLLAKLLHETVRALRFENYKVYAWTDSEITLCWIKAPPSRWETFVRNRVAEVQKLTNIDSWKHIPSEQNPADIASRGVFPSQLLDNDIWWYGPTFLNTTWNITFPTQPNSFETEEGRHTAKAHCVMNDKNNISEEIQRHSSLTKLTRVISYCKRFAENLRKEKLNREKGPLTPRELHSATLAIVRIAQMEMFPSKVRTNIAKIKGLKALNPIVDEQNVLRVGGRLQNADSHYEQQHPIILKATHHYTELIISDAHYKTLHGGVQKMVSYLRQRFWICGIKNAVNVAAAVMNKT